jgi:hypothetical protein
MRHAHPVSSERRLAAPDDVLVPVVPGRPLMVTIDVHCDPSVEGGWSCEVALREGGLDVSRHRVKVSAGDLTRLGGGAPTPNDLVRASFAFLLEREPPGSILHAFRLADISRYFPEYERQIQGTKG